MGSSSASASASALDLHDQTRQRMVLEATQSAEKDHIIAELQEEKTRLQDRMVVMKSTQQTEVATAQQHFQASLATKEEECQRLRVDNKILTEAVVSKEKAVVTKEEECQRLRMENTTLKKAALSQIATLATKEEECQRLRVEHTTSPSTATSSESQSADPITSVTEEEESVTTTV